jgi:hypothetical protein
LIVIYYNFVGTDGVVSRWMIASRCVVYATPVITIQEGCTAVASFI